MKISEIARLTQYTETYIRRECRLGRLKAIKAATGKRPEYLIAEADYETWRDYPPCERRAFKTRTTSHYKPRVKRI